MDRETFDATIRTFENRTPFRPFTISLVNGERLEVDHPDTIIVREGLGLFAGPGRDPRYSITRGSPKSSGTWPIARSSDRRSPSSDKAGA